LNGEYRGEARASNCVDNDFIVGFGTTSATTTLDIDSEDIALTIEFFDEPTLLMTGSVDDSSGILTASGTYQSSDFTSGEWSIDQVFSPYEGVILFSINFSGECTGTAEISGFYRG